MFTIKCGRETNQRATAPSGNKSVNINAVNRGYNNNNPLSKHT